MSQASNNNNITTKSTAIGSSHHHHSHHHNRSGSQGELLRRDLAQQLDERIGEFGGSIRTEWEEIKRFVASEIQSNLTDAVRADVEGLLEHPQLRELVRRLRVGRPDTETQAEVLDKMTSTMLPKVRRNHRQFLDHLNQQVSQMIVQLMRNDQLAVVIDDEKILHHLFRLAASDDESSQRT